MGAQRREASDGVVVQAADDGNDQTSTGRPVLGRVQNRQERIGAVQLHLGQADQGSVEVLVGAGPRVG